MHHPLACQRERFSDELIEGRLEAIPRETTADGSALPVHLDEYFGIRLDRSLRKLAAARSAGVAKV
jgi:hypothetical protein